MNGLSDFPEANVDRTINLDIFSRLRPTLRSLNIFGRISLGLKFVGYCKKLTTPRPSYVHLVYGNKRLFRFNTFKTKREWFLEGFVYYPYYVQYTKLANHIDIPPEPRLAPALFEQSKYPDGFDIDKVRNMLQDMSEGKDVTFKNEKT